jgi:hypothetical protein
MFRWLGIQFLGSYFHGGWSLTKLGVGNWTVIICEGALTRVVWRAHIASRKRHLPYCRSLNAFGWHWKTIWFCLLGCLRSSGPSRGQKVHISVVGKVESRREFKWFLNLHSLCFTSFSSVSIIIYNCLTNWTTIITHSCCPIFDTF